MEISQEWKETLKQNKKYFSSLLKGFQYSDIVNIINHDSITNKILNLNKVHHNNEWYVLCTSFSVNA